jgi:hypothetical protein
MSDYQASPTNLAFALQCAISGIVSIGGDLGADVDHLEWAMTIVRKWPFHATLLEPLHSLLERYVLPEIKVTNKADQIAGERILRWTSTWCIPISHRPCSHTSVNFGPQSYAF